MKIGEAMTGLSEEMADVGMTIERAERKTDEMQARASAIDELIAAVYWMIPWERRTVWKQNSGEYRQMGVWMMNSPA